MIVYQNIGRRPFVRDADRAVIAGVCAGIAEYFGFNRRVVRLLAIIAFFMAAPVTLCIYFGIVFLTPSVHSPERQLERDLEFEQALRSSPRQTMGDVKRRYQSLDTRLARLERYVTSPRFDLDQEFRKL